MLPLGMSRKELRVLHALLRSNHTVSVSVQILDLNHKYVGDVSSRLTDGQVNIDADAEVSRSLDIVLFDPNFTLNLDSDAPDDGALYLDRMVRVVYSVAPPDLSTWYDIPVFCGPITKIERNSVFLSVEAQGKETLAFASLWRTRTYRKGLAKTTIIRRNFENVIGEKKLQIPNMDERIPRNLSMGLDSSAWGVNVSLARSLSRQLFYDGRGVARLRPTGEKPVFVFNEGTIKTKPQVGYDTENVKNAVLVIGSKPKGANKRIRVRMVASRKHPLSPFRLSRTNKDGEVIPRYIPFVIRNDSVRSKSKARKVAKKALRNALMESLDVSFDALVIPHLEPLDVCRIDTGEFVANFRLRKMTIPLTADGTSNIGYIRKASPNKRAIRGRRRRGR